MNFPHSRKLFYGLPNLLLYFNYLWNKKVPKLLESYDTWYKPFHIRIVMGLVDNLQIYHGCVNCFKNNYYYKKIKWTH